MSESNASQASTGAGHTSAGSTSTSASTKVSVYAWIDVEDGKLRPRGGFSGFPVSAYGTKVDWIKSFGQKVRTTTGIQEDGVVYTLLKTLHSTQPAVAESMWSQSFLNETKEAWTESGRTENVEFVLKTKAQYLEDVARSPPAVTIYQGQNSG
jgi:hypothetical protein